uniref:Uncharacterized protein n=1 Tax=Glossina pallidipes TaxID=7398 RepID=A0A1B0A360_GLOPL
MHNRTVNEICAGVGTTIYLPPPLSFTIYVEFGGAISTLTTLLSTKRISFLFLPSCWGARDDPPSSSGVSMGSGSGSSTGTSCLIKQDTCSNLGKQSSNRIEKVRQECLPGNILYSNIAMYTGINNSLKFKLT